MPPAPATVPPQPQTGPRTGPRSDVLPDVSRDVLPVLLAGGAGTRLHELSGVLAKPLLPVAGRRLADFALAALTRAGAGRVRVVLPRGGDAILRHLREAWGETLAIEAIEAAETTAASLKAATARHGGAALVLPADQVQALDLRALLAAHREGGAPATLAAPEGAGPCAPGPCILGPEALRGLGDGGDLWADRLPGLPGLGRWSPPPGTYCRDVDTLDDLLAASVEMRGWAEGAAPLELPPPSAALLPSEEEEGRALALEAGGLRLSVPRLSARSRGRWTLLEDCLVMPGARVAPGARLSRAVVAPGAIVPANLTVGEDPGGDARWFRVTPGGTTLVTAAMLARRATELARASLGSRLDGLPEGRPDDRRAGLSAPKVP